MANVLKIILLIIDFIIYFIIFTILRFLILPETQIGVYQFRPKWLFVGVYRFLLGLGLVSFTIFMLLFLVFYVLWLIIKKFIPNFPIPFKMILLALPPFRQLEQTGVFDLISNIIKAIVSKEKLKKLGQAFEKFIKKNGSNVINMIKTVAPLTENKSKQEDNSKSSSTTTSANKESSAFTSDQERFIEEQYRQCVEEGKQFPKSDSEITSKNNENQMKEMECKMKRMQSYTNIISFT